MPMFGALIENFTFVYNPFYQILRHCPFNMISVQHDTLWFFNDQLCRALPMVYHATVQHKGLPSYRLANFCNREKIVSTHEAGDKS